MNANNEANETKLDKGKLLTIREAAERVGLSERSMRFRIATGCGPVLKKLGRRTYRVFESDLADWIEAAK